MQQGAKGGWSGGYAVGSTPGRYGQSPFDPRITEWLKDWARSGAAPPVTATATAGPSGVLWTTSRRRRSGRCWPRALSWGYRCSAAPLATPSSWLAADLALEATADGDRRGAASATPGVRGRAGGVRRARCGRHQRALRGALNRQSTPRQLRSDGPSPLARRAGAHPLPRRDHPGCRRCSDFLESVYPTLRRRVRLRCFDGSITLPRAAGASAGADRSAHRRQTRSIFTGRGRTAPFAARCTRRRTWSATRRRRRAVMLRVEESTAGGFQLHEETELHGGAAIQFVHDLLPVLEASDDVIVEAVELPTYREIDEPPLVTVGVDETDDPDWFDLAIRISVEGRDVPFAAAAHCAGAPGGLPGAGGRRLPAHRPDRPRSPAGVGRGGAHGSRTGRVGCG